MRQSPSRRIPGSTWWMQNGLRHSPGLASSDLRDAQSHPVIRNAEPTSGVVAGGNSARRQPNVSTPEERNCGIRQGSLT